MANKLQGYEGCQLRTWKESGDEVAHRDLSVAARFDTLVIACTIVETLRRGSLTVISVNRNVCGLSEMYRKFAT
jgi:hypothetical protein